MMFSIIGNSICVVLWIIIGILVMKLGKQNKAIQPFEYFLCWLTLIIQLIGNILEVVIK